jgi:hypothetical protein
MAFDGLITVTGTSGSTAGRNALTATLLNAEDAIDRARLALLRSEPTSW